MKHCQRPKIIPDLRAGQGGHAFFLRSGGIARGPCWKGDKRKTPAVVAGVSVFVWLSRRARFQTCAAAASFALVRA
jgi:hypothetical protein